MKGDDITEVSEWLEVWLYWAFGASSGTGGPSLKSLTKLEDGNLKIGRFNLLQILLSAVSLSLPNKAHEMTGNILKKCVLLIMRIK